MTQPAMAAQAQHDLFKENAQGPLFLGSEVVDEHPGQSRRWGAWGPPGEAMSDGLGEGTGAQRACPATARWACGRR